MRTTLRERLVARGHGPDHQTNVEPETAYKTASLHYVYKKETNDWQCKNDIKKYVLHKRSHWIQFDLINQIHKKQLLSRFTRETATKRNWNPKANTYSLTNIKKSLIGTNTTQKSRKEPYKEILWSSRGASLLLSMQGHSLICFLSLFTVCTVIDELSSLWIISMLSKYNQMYYPSCLGTLNLTHEILVQHFYCCGF